MPLTPALRGRAARAGLMALALLLPACQPMRNRGPEAEGTHIATGDMITGRLATEAPAQRFSFEGVESSLLDFTLQSDELNRPAPTVVLTDPSGQPVNLEMHRTSPKGAATSTFQGVVLLRTGPYTLDVTSADQRRDSWYIFKHQLRFPSVVGCAGTLCVRPVSNTVRNSFARPATARRHAAAFTRNCASERASCSCSTFSVRSRLVSPR